MPGDPYAAAPPGASVRRRGRRRPGVLRIGVRDDGAERHGRRRSGVRGGGRHHRGTARDAGALGGTGVPGGARRRRRDRAVPHPHRRRRRPRRRARGSHRGSRGHRRRLRSAHVVVRRAQPDAHDDGLRRRAGSDPCVDSARRDLVERRRLRPPAHADDGRAAGADRRGAGRGRRRRVARRTALRGVHRAVQHDGTARGVGARDVVDNRPADRRATRRRDRDAKTCCSASRLNSRPPNPGPTAIRRCTHERGIAYAGSVRSSSPATSAAPSSRNISV